MGSEGGKWWRDGVDIEVIFKGFIIKGRGKDKYIYDWDVYFKGKFICVFYSNI